MQSRSGVPVGQRTWDIVVVGGGTGGIVASRTAASLGARVLLIERARTGGDCLWTGCVPSKALLAAARHAVDSHRAHGLGVHAPAPTVDFAAVMAHVKGAIAAIEPEDSPATLRAAGVHVMSGEARFTSPGRLEVSGRPVAFRRAIIATGSGPAVPPIQGLREARPLTSDTVWDLDALPERLLVLGGGAIGCELGQAFARLGASVTIVEAAPRILAGEDPEAACIVHSFLVRDGVRVLTGHSANKVKGEPDGPGVLMASRGEGADVEDVELEYDRLLVSVGRTSGSAGLDLSEAGVVVDDRGFVEVDGTLRTSNARIWAVGDVTAVSRFTHTAGVHGATAATNAVLGLRRKVDLTAVPRVTYTDPEVAAVGKPTWAEDGQGAPRIVTRHHVRVDRAIVEARTEGFTRLALGPSSRLVGATVVGPRAGETLAELTLAVRKGLTTGDIAGTTHPYPTYGDGPWNAAIADVKGRLSHPLLRGVTWAIARARRALPLR